MITYFVVVTFLFIMKDETLYNSNIDEICLDMSNKSFFNSF